MIHLEKPRIVLGMPPEFMMTENIRKNINDEEAYDKDKYYEIDEDFHVTFCPVCGSNDINAYGKANPLMGNCHSWGTRCCRCGWEFEIFILKEGRRKVKVRFDSRDCKICQKRNKEFHSP
jgi:hypothetical protein